MPLTISNNSAVAAASYHLGKNQSLLQLSIKKLASGKKIISPNDDPGTLSVAMKLNASVTRLSGARNNVQNAISYLEVQDGILENAGRIVNRMAELKGMSSQDPMKSAQDIESYDNEFHDLQRQLYDISQMTFNGSSLFANSSSPATGAPVDSIFKNDSRNNTISIHTSDQGNAGTKISLHRAALLSALTIPSSSGTGNCSVGATLVHTKSSMYSSGFAMDFTCATAASSKLNSCRLAFKCSLS